MERVHVYMYLVCSFVNKSIYIECPIIYGIHFTCTFRNNGKVHKIQICILRSNVITLTCFKLENGKNYVHMYVLFVLMNNFELIVYKYILFVKD